MSARVGAAATPTFTGVTDLDRRSVSGPHGSVDLEFNICSAAVPAANGGRWREIRRTRSAAATELAKRHGTYPILARSVSERLGGWDEYRRRYLVPLLYTLEQGLRSGKPYFLDIYRAQRTRFYPRDLLASGGQGELEAVLDDDRKVLVEHAAAGGGVADFLEAVNRRSTSDSWQRASRSA